MVVLLGSPRDHPAVRGAVDVLDEFGVASQVHALSAHRTQHALVELVDDVVERGPAVFICAAGLAAHLAGLVAGRCVLPVIGLPLSRGPLSGMDSLLSTVQMPEGVPVATVGIDAARNAGLLAVQMLGLSDATLRAALSEHRAATVVEYADFGTGLVRSAPEADDSGASGSATDAGSSAPEVSHSGAGHSDTGVGSSGTGATSAAASSSGSGGSGDVGHTGGQR